VILEVLKLPELLHELHDCAVAGHYLELESVHFTSLLKIPGSDSLPSSTYRNVLDGTMFPHGHHKSTSSIANLKNFPNLNVILTQKGDLFIIGLTLT
jgi:hypothetical protein